MHVLNNGGESVYGRRFPADVARSGQRTIATAGTAQSLITSNFNESISGLYIKALSGNSGSVYIGNDGSGDVTSSNGFELEAGDVIFLNESNPENIILDSANDGDGVSFIYV